MNSNDVTPIDIQSEAARTYHYADGKSYTIDSPFLLYVFEGKSGWTQRVVDGHGVTHRPPPGWLAISWTPVPGGLSFVA